MLKFSRQTFSTFKAKDSNNGNIVEYRVQDLPEDNFEETLDLFVEHYLSAEPFSVAKNFLANPESVKAIRIFYRKMLNKGLSIACFKNDGTDELVGVNILAVRSKHDVSSDEVSKQEAVSDI